jgi:mannose-1-phosphate guanylyltransferase
MEKSIGIHYINAGIYLLEPAVLDFIPSSRKTSIERETFPLLLQKDKVLFGYPTDGFFIDIGTPAGYAEFQNYIKRMEAWR